jgi:diadenosine tetraphosphate (Ap4A) HIT family hydrolase
MLDREIVEQEELKNSVSIRESSECSFCGELHGRVAPMHSLLVPGAPKSRILIETDHWSLFPSIGPLVPGHLLIVPREHVCSILSCPAPAITECLKLATDCAARLAAIYKSSVLVFEHGSVQEEPNYSGTCIKHAHLHILPGPLSCIDSALGELESWHGARTLFDLPSGFDRIQYLLVGLLIPRSYFWVHECAEPIPSQLLRRVFAKQLQNEDEWDWRRYPRANVFTQTIRDWRLARKASGV